ncbi:TonB-dependent receptor plug domain-containing protein [Burkholderia lata]|uniref:TonB-dependent receptor plug domain-containing protein n=1 Tax=Burkholderia lata (strain ATCC 17760 / DSM 23089 / LMG 22485 / NCIMB 9086 / R18194 / 383) TaxID=482957 RepID=UPI0020C612B4|nr:TonB-dependent receptor [Burkholderia lata]
MTYPRRRSLALAAYWITAGGAAWAQGGTPNPTPASDAQDVVVTVQDVVVTTGTRENARKMRDAAAPVEVIGGDALRRTGQGNLRDALVQLSPSIARQAMRGDAGNLTSALTLHGLSPDYVLVLVNGKRRHSTANVSLNRGPQQGSTGVDVDLIPIAAIDHVEILRDGASAQYGSDAIAGVINVILKSDYKGGELSNTTGQTYQGDGLAQNNAANIGLRLGDAGYLDLSAEYNRQNHTVRTGADPRTGQNDNLILGSPASTREAVAFNAGYLLEGGAKLYGFGTYAHRNGSSYQNYRLPSVLPTLYPNGFTPQETLNENDFSLTAGVKGDRLLGWAWDISSTYGRDNIGIGMVNSANTSLFDATGSTPTGFRLSTFTSTQWTNNLDLSRAFHLPLLPAPLNVSVGVEHRHESYTVGAGDPASTFGAGSQALPGLSPLSALSKSREVLGTYVDLATRLAPNWQLDLAGRFEHYNDVGGTTNGKVSTRYDITPRIAVRGSVGTGFRAPSLAQQHFTNLNISPLSAYGQLAPNSQAARNLGATPLKPEKSTNFDIGLVLNPLPNLNVTIDAYQINIRDRIVQGGTYSGQPAIDALTQAGITLPAGLPSVTANYFTNGVNTRTRGVDILATYHSNFARWGSVDWDLGINFNTTSVTSVGRDTNGNTLLNAQQVGYITSSTPKNKIIVGGTWHRDKWALSLHETRYGTTSGEESYWSGPNAYSTTRFAHFTNAARYVTDVELRYAMTRKFEIAVGANNLFNVYPSKLPAENQFLGTQYDIVSSPIGINGGFYYLRARYLL